MLQKRLRQVKKYLLFAILKTNKEFNKNEPINQPQNIPKIILLEDIDIIDKYYFYGFNLIRTQIILE